MTRVVQRAFCMLLLLGCDTVCAGQTATKYVPFLWLWIAVTVSVGLVFIAQTVRELNERETQ